MKNELVRLKFKKGFRSIISGEFRSGHTDISSYDFKELKPFQFGNDIRSIDLKSRAMRNDYFSRARQPERITNIYFCVDNSSSLLFSSQSQTKRDIQIEILSLLTQAGLHGNNRIAFIVFDEKIQSYILQNNAEHVLNSFDEIKRLPCENNDSRLSAALQVIETTIETPSQKPSAIFILSDFICDPSYEKILVRLNETIDVIAFIIRDPLENNFSQPRFSSVHYTDIETNSYAFAAPVSLPHDTTNEILKRITIDHLSLSTTESYETRTKKIIDFFDERKS
ncbi:MAG: VWA domain-containing protein [Parcubacteria group bacterium]|nr:VWA domain-containing protein [Parcubacteria group bacterium]